MQTPDSFLGPSTLFMMLPIVLFYLGMLTTPVVVIVLIVRFLRAYERRTKVLGEERGGHARVEVLESNIEQLRAELARVQDGQQFTNQLLAEQPGRTPPRP
ncbi:MAG: hypothetical protein ABJB74_19320 [Gemmatimonas sp.]